MTMIRRGHRNFSNLLNWQYKSISINGRFMRHLRYAEHVLLVVSSAEELQATVLIVNNASLNVT